MEISVEHKPASEDCDFVRNRLHEHNAAIVGPDNYAPLAILVRDDTGTIRAGLLGETFWNWLHISTVWVNESDRGKGLGTRLLALAEEEGIRRGCISAFLDSLSFQAPDFYLKRGYEIWGELEDFPVGHRRTFLQKELVGGEVPGGRPGRDHAERGRRGREPVDSRAAHRGDSPAGGGDGRGESPPGMGIRKGGRSPASRRRSLLWRNRGKQLPRGFDAFDRGLDSRLTHHVQAGLVREGLGGFPGYGG